MGASRVAEQVHVVAKDFPLLVFFAENVRGANGDHLGLAPEVKILAVMPGMESIRVARVDMPGSRTQKKPPRRVAGAACEESNRQSYLRPSSAACAAARRATGTR